MKDWSWYACCFIQGYVEHAYRHKDNIVYKLINAQNNKWLKIKRTSFLSSIHTQSAGRTGTRARGGRPIRWRVEAMDGVNTENPERCKDKMKANANLLHYQAMR